MEGRTFESRRGQQNTALNQTVRYSERSDSTVVGNESYLVILPWTLLLPTVIKIRVLVAEKNYILSLTSSAASSVLSAMSSLASLTSSPMSSR